MSVRFLILYAFKKYSSIRKIAAINIYNANSNIRNYNNYLNLYNGVSNNITKNFCRSKYTKKTKATENDSDDEKDENDFADEKDSKIVNIKLNSLRADLILKAGLGMARNKVEANFYDSKIRVNGKKISKKSIQLNINDEIDIIRGFSQMNPSHLLVSRVQILSAKEGDENLSVTLRRYKNLVIENYEGANACKLSEVST